MKAAVFGASGYGGQAAMRLLLDHPEVSRVLPVSSSAAGSSVDERDGGLGPDPEGKLPEGRRLLTREEALSEAPDAVFAALPHGASAEFCEPFFGKSVVFDLSADFRLYDAAVHERAYGAKAPYPALRDSTVYGLAEIYEDRIKKADIIAVPGCFPTGALLPLIPAAREGIANTAITVNLHHGTLRRGPIGKRNDALRRAFGKRRRLQSGPPAPASAGNASGSPGRGRKGRAVLYAPHGPHAPRHRHDHNDCRRRRSGGRRRKS